MNRRIVIAIDADFSPQTQYILHVAGSFLEISDLHLGVVLLHVIPLPDLPPTKFGTSSVTPTVEQREKAEQACQQARMVLQQQGFTSNQIDIHLRSGTPSDEIVKVAKELHADFVLIGSRGNSFIQQLRRFVTGSISHRVLKLAPCSVIYAPLPHISHSIDLVIWYQEAITRHLQKHSGKLMIFTSSEAAHLFAPPGKTPGSHEREAASLALEHLAERGLLVCQKINGEWRCTND